MTDRDRNVPEKTARVRVALSRDSPRAVDDPNVPKKTPRVREQAVVYLAERDRELLERLAEETGLSRTELFRRGLRKLARELLTEQKPGSSLDHLIDHAGESELPADVSERHDDYLYGGGYKRLKRERARSR